jgi:hypothetical protein
MMTFLVTLKWCFQLKRFCFPKQQYLTSRIKNQFHETRPVETHVRANIGKPSNPATVGRVASPRRQIHQTTTAFSRQIWA